MEIQEIVDDLFETAYDGCIIKPEIKSELTKCFVAGMIMGAAQCANTELFNDLCQYMVDNKLNTDSEFVNYKRN